MGECVPGAQDPRLEHEVAVKVLFPEITDARASPPLRPTAPAPAGTLKNPAEAYSPVYDVGTDDDSPFLVLELLEGETLRARVEARTASRRKALDYALKIAQGLAGAHEKESSTATSSPTTSSCSATTGLGSSTRSRELTRSRRRPSARNGHRSRATESGMVLGTVGYMSPEQVRGAGRPALGHLLVWRLPCEMLAGGRAFRPTAQIETINAILKEPARAYPGARRRISPGVARIVRNCIEERAREPGSNRHTITLTRSRQSRHIVSGTF